MQNKKVQDYIKAEIAKGTDDETIKKNLLANGWTTKELEEALTGEKSSNLQIGTFQNEELNAPLPFWKVLVAILGIGIILWFVIALSQLFPM
jgi:hypothetical protein